MFANRFFFLLLPAIVSLAYCKPPWADSEWENWKKGQGKGNQYGNSAEHEKRKGIFKKNWEFIQEHNEKRGLAFKVAANKFADVDNSEYSKLLGAKMPENIQSAEPNKETNVKASFFDDMPESLDWRTKGAVTPVKDQGYCGSCWTFAMTGVLEGRYFVKSGKLISLSEQQVLDCASNTRYRCNGCDGGWVNNAFWYIRDAGGLNTEAAYPYTKRQGTCHTKNGTEFQFAKLNYDGPSMEVMSGEMSLMLALEGGPVAAAMDATLDSFKFYSSGVYNDPKCTVSNNHAVLIIGYGTDAETGTPYWLVKNSYGTFWGEKGYFRLARGANTCGILRSLSYPIMA